MRQLVIWCAVWGLGLTGWTASGQTAEPPSRQFFSPETVLLVEVQQPVQIVTHQFWQRVTAALQRSGAVRDLLVSPQLDPVRDLLQSVETEFQKPVLEVISEAAGESFVFGTGAQPEQEWALVVTGKNADVVARIPETLLKFARQIQSARGQSIPDPQQRDYHGQPVSELGPFHFAVRGHRFCLTSQRTLLEGILDRLEQRQPLTTTGLAGAATTETEHLPAVRVRLQGAWLRSQPGMVEALRLPHPDPGALFVLGGWLDLVRRSESLTLEVNYSAETVTSLVRFSARATEMLAGLKPFFGTTPEAGALPPITVPHTLVTASWYRDYARLWELRDETLNSEAGRKAEADNSETAKRNRGTGPLETLKMIGPHHRVVAARVVNPPYTVPVSNRLPALAYLVDLRDEEGFRKKALPQAQELLAIIGLIFKMVAQKQEYQGTEIRSLRFAEDAATVAQGDRIRYNFEPAYALYRGHLIMGSTTEIVRQCIDQLSLEPQPTPPAIPGVTEIQRYEFTEFAPLIDDLREISLREAALTQGLTFPEAEHELKVLQELLAQLGQLRVAAADTEQGFEYRMELQPVEDK